MPELPEVETTRRGVAPLVVGKVISGVAVRNASLRQPVPSDLSTHLVGEAVLDVRRRAKYLLFGFSSGTMLIHLGMSGSLRVVPRVTAAEKHDHVDIQFDDGTLLRYRDARRFGLIVWTGAEPLAHPLLSHLGPEPLSEDFDGAWLARRASKRKAAVKTFLMDQRMVVGVGNIYASEALYRACIHPSRPAGEITRESFDRLAIEVKTVLSRAIEEGGTTLRDFSGVGGEPGYFTQSLSVYGRDGQPCPGCGGRIEKSVIGQRSSFYCSQCQR